MDPWSHRLRRLYEPATYARLRARGWFVVPGEEDGWWCAAHPDSRTLAGLELLYPGHPRELSEQERLRLGRRPAGAPRRGSHRPALDPEAHAAPDGRRARSAWHGAGMVGTGGERVPRVRAARVSRRARRETAIAGRPPARSRRRSHQPVTAG